MPKLTHPDGQLADNNQDSKTSQATHLTDADGRLPLWIKV
jgi:hypothetical protein